MGTTHIGARSDATGLFELNVEAYPQSANTYDNLSDADLAAGNKVKALEFARKALEQLPLDKTAPDEFKRQIRESAEGKIRSRLYVVLVGTTLLHYTITRALGSGGMGVVYEAEDAKLGRRVALKFLSPELARDRPALERFLREARAASALNHPNICTIYAIEETNGEYFIAMELLDGDALDRRIAENPLTLDGLLDLGVQVADALDAAHQRGIIHRDIKPANIFVTREGRAKVLDFGVAKVASRGEAATVLAGTAAQLTGPGMAVGTIAYMSPEQARGDEIDARSDLFSLAAVLYEMATGQPAFKGKTSAVIFQQILGETPAPPAELNPAVPQKLDDLIIKGLEKDRDLRYQTAAELRGDLKRLRRDASAGKLTTASSATGTSVRPISSGAVLVAEAKRRKGLTTIVGGLLLGLAGAASYGLFTLFSRDGTTSSPPAAVAQLDVTRVTTSGLATGCGSISPDGKTVAYCDFGGELFAVQVATGAQVSLGRIPGSTTFSPDGNYVFVSWSSQEDPQGVLLMIPAFGGSEPRRILTGISGAVGISPDGKRIAFLREFPQQTRVALMLADATGGNERELTSTREQESPLNGGVSWSPDGKWLSATQAVTGAELAARPVMVDVSSGEIHALGSQTWPDVGRTVWLPGNRVLFSATERAIEVYQFWIAHVPGGPARRITDEARGFGNMSVGVTADGSTIATVPWVIVSNLFETNADATSPLTQWTSGVLQEGDSIGPLSTGRVYYDSSDGSNHAVWSVDSAGGRPRKLTQGFTGGVSIPDDGRFVLLHSLVDGTIRIARVESDGTGLRLLTSGERVSAGLVSPDGRWVYYGSKGGLRRMSSDGGPATPVGQDLDVAWAVSPDGRRLLVERTPEPGSNVWGAIVDAETGVVHTTVDVRGTKPKWGRTNDVLASLVRDDKGIENLWEWPIAGGKPRQLTTFTSGRTFNFAYSPDRKRLFLARGTRTGDVTLIRGFQ